MVLHAILHVLHGTSFPQKAGNPIQALQYMAGGSSSSGCTVRLARGGPSGGGRACEHRVGYAAGTLPARPWQGAGCSVSSAGEWRGAVIAAMLWRGRPTLGSPHSAQGPSWAQLLRQGGRCVPAPPCLFNHDDDLRGHSGRGPAADGGPEAGHRCSSGRWALLDREEGAICRRSARTIRSLERADTPLAEASTRSYRGGTQTQTSL
jgi:hypothetical protein